MPANPPINYMTVVLKANQLNCLIYKYLLESGLSHTAYTFFNEASLAQPLQEIKFDIKSGHLLSLLEKALVYAQIQSHVSFHEYEQCNEPFHLVRAHTCRIVQKVKQQRTDLFGQLQQQINDSIRRTNSIYHTAVANKEFQDIIYDPKGSRYLQKFPKFKLPPGEPGENPTARLTLTGTPLTTLLYNSEQFQVILLRYDHINDQVSVQRIVPCVKQGQLSRSYYETVTDNKLVQLFQNNHVTLIDFNQNTFPQQFRLDLPQALRVIKCNEELPHLICFANDETHMIVNLNNKKAIRTGRGKFWWKDYDQYLVSGYEGCFLMSLSQEKPLKFYAKQDFWQDIQFNQGKTLFSLISYREKCMRVYTYENQQPLFIFNIESILKQVIFLTSNGVDYLCWLTDSQIQVFDLSLNAYNKSIDVNVYDDVGVSQISVLKKDENQCYLIALGNENILVFDVNTGKIQRIELEQKVYQMKQLTNERIGLVTETSIYVLVGHLMDGLFKQ